MKCLVSVGRNEVERKGREVSSQSRSRSDWKRVAGSSTELAARKERSRSSEKGSRKRTVCNERSVAEEGKDENGGGSVSCKVARSPNDSEDVEAYSLLPHDAVPASSVSEQAIAGAETEAKGVSSTFYRVADLPPSFGLSLPPLRANQTHRRSNSFFRCMAIS